jgi:hypothetical protein
LHPELSKSDATMITFDTAISVQLKVAAVDLSQTARFCTNVKKKQYRAGCIDCVVVSLSGPGAGAQHFILPAADFNKLHEDDQKSYFTVRKWINVPTTVMYKIEQGQELRDATPTQWCRDLCAYNNAEPPALTSPPAAYLDEKYTDFWSKYFVDLNQWVQTAERLNVNKHLYCGVMWQHCCFGKKPNTAAAALVADWDRLLAAM